MLSLRIVLAKFVQLSSDGCSTQKKLTLSQQLGHTHLFYLFPKLPVSRQKAAPESIGKDMAS
jgi:hypothetical protein